MKTYRIKATFTFSGEFYVKADDKEEAKQMVESECGMTFGHITSIADDEHIDWDFNMIPEKKIKSITVKREKSKKK
jgi:hypothetical protein